MESSSPSQTPIDREPLTAGRILTLTMAAIAGVCVVMALAFAFGVVDMGAPDRAPALIAPTADATAKPSTPTDATPSRDEISRAMRAQNGEALNVDGPTVGEVQEIMRAGAPH